MHVNLISSNNGRPNCQRFYEDRLAAARHLESRRMSWVSNHLKEEVRTSRSKGTSRRNSGPQGQENLVEQAESRRGPPCRMGIAGSEKKIGPPRSSHEEMSEASVSLNKWLLGEEIRSFEDTMKVLET